MARFRPAELLLFALLGLGSSAGALDIGQAAPAASAKTIDGADFDLLSATRDHAAVAVLFLSTVCPYSKFFAEQYKSAFAEYGKRGVLFVGVFSNETEPAAEVSAYARAHALDLPIIRDAGARVADQLDAKRTPEAFVFDRESKLRYHGRIESKYRSPDLRNALDDLLRGVPVKLAEAKVFGCAILRP
jgi:peroxiredoxin